MSPKKSLRRKWPVATNLNDYQLPTVNIPRPPGPSFLNITNFTDCPLLGTPMLEVLRQTSKNVFVPLTIGGGIRNVADPDGTVHSALEVAKEYFVSGADKLSIGSDAVAVAEAYYANNSIPTGIPSIEQISSAYRNQAAVVLIDPRRTTVKGGREPRPLSVQALTSARVWGAAVEYEGGCEDPSDCVLGAGKPDHFVEVFERTETDAALGAGCSIGRSMSWAGKECIGGEGVIS
ncbi:hypothetical protein BGX38DRAFT_1273561 [Terfezia claveryi]|nr:hypothetical protein BGX38DRAFT_1273561 [Terfezia claveryi]